MNIALEKNALKVNKMITIKHIVRVNDVIIEGIK